MAEAVAGQLAIVAGGGVTPENVADLVRRSGVREVHLSARRPRPSAMAYTPSLSLSAAAVPPDGIISTADRSILHACRAALHSTQSTQSPPL